MPQKGNFSRPVANSHLIFQFFLSQVIIIGYVWNLIPFLCQPAVPRAAPGLSWQCQEPLPLLSHVCHTCVTCPKSLLRPGVPMLGRDSDSGTAREMVSTGGRRYGGDFGEGETIREGSGRAARAIISPKPNLPKPGRWRRRTQNQGVPGCRWSCCGGWPGTPELSLRAVPAAEPCRAEPCLCSALLSEGGREGRMKGLATPSESRPRRAAAARDIRPPAAPGAAAAPDHGPAQR